MGMFSWITSDTEQSVSNKYSSNGAVPAKMIAPDGREWPEQDYEGCGEFGGKDFYELVDELNGGSGDRENGINLCFGDNSDNIVKPKIVSIDCKIPYDQLEDSRSCPDQGIFCEEEEEEDVEEDEEDEEEVEYEDEDEE